MNLRGVILDVEQTFGMVKFKKISMKIFKYDSDNKKTDEFIGYKVLVESVLKRDVFEVKIYDDSIERYTSLSNSENNMYDVEIQFDNLEYNAYLFRGKLFQTLSADSFAVVTAYD